ncbi:unnamed protein product [Sympodiomycopsis kandeliae]
MADSPSKERSSRGQHSRSRALASSNSSVTPASPPPALSSASPMLLPTTTTINASSTNAQGSSSKNPLLQQDVTASDLFTHYSPNEISQHLSNLKVKLSTYDSELKALINNRYEDILSVGNTISSMKGSAVHLTEALQSIGNGMRGQSGQASITLEKAGSSSNGQQMQNQSQEEEMQIQAHKRVKYVAALLLIMQEAPEEIWRLLETSSHHQTSIASTSSKHSLEDLFLQCKANLKSARSLSLAASILYILKHAGKEINLLPQDVRALFPHPLSNHNNTVASIDAELKSNLIRLIADSSVALASNHLEPSCSKGTLQPCLEATLRTCILSLSSLIQLGHLSMSEAPSFFLQQRRKVLEQWSSSGSFGNSNSGRLGSHLQVLYQEVAEVLVLYQQMFCVDGGAVQTVMSRFVARETHISADSVADNLDDTTESKVKNLCPPSSLAALRSLPSSEHTLCCLADDAGLRKILQDSVQSIQGGINISSDVLQGSYVGPVHKSITEQWAPRLLERASKNKDIGRAKRDLYRASKQIGKTLSSALSRDSQSLTTAEGCLQTLLDDLQRRLDTHATDNWKQEINEWRSECKMVLLRSLQQSKSSMSNDVFHQLLLSCNAAANGGADLRLKDSMGKQTAKGSNLQHDDNATTLDKILHGYGPSSSLNEWFKVLESGWTRIQSSKEDYFIYPSYRGDADNLRATWTEVEGQAGWIGLFDDLRNMLDDARSKVIPSAEGSPERYDEVILFSHAVRLLATLPKYITMVNASFKDGRDEYTSKRNQLLQSRKDAIGMWRADVILRAQSLSRRQQQQEIQLVDSLAYLHQQSYSVLGTDSIPHQQDPDCALLRIGSFVDLVEGFSTQLHENKELLGLPEHDLELLRCVLSSASTTPSSKIDELLGDKGRPEGSGVNQSLRTYRLLFGLKIGETGEKGQSLPSNLSTAAPMEPTPPFALATNSKRLRGIQVG